VVLAIISFGGISLLNSDELAACSGLARGFCVWPMPPVGAQAVPSVRVVMIEGLTAWPFFNSPKV
jgi:hypothetical protein